MATESQIRKKVIDTAKKYIGAKKGSTKHRQIIDIFNTVKPDGGTMTYSASWCAAFASAIEIEALGKTDAKKICPLSYNCGTIIAKAKKLGIWIEKDSYKPKVADWILYDWQDSGRGDNTGAPDHVGIVESVKDGVITIIEGNKGSASEVARRKVGINGRYIRGFVAIQYKELAGKETANKTLKVGSKIKIKTGAHQYGKTKGFSDKVYKTTYKVVELKGSRVVFATTEGTVIGAVNKNDCIVQ